MKKSNFCGLNGTAILLFKALLFALTLNMANSVAVISIDLGTEFMKIGIVKPGVPMEIVLNKESRRKTPLAVSLRGVEREFGSLALSQSIKKPKTAYLYLSTILAKSLDSAAVKAYKEKYPFYEIKEDPETKTVYFQHDANTKYTPEELLAMILDHARELAADFGEQPIDAAVIAVPAYFTQAERKAVLQAADLAGLKVLQLLNSNTAAGLNYGVFRRKDFNTTGNTMMFFDMGATGTTATIATYHVIKHKDDYESNPQLVIRGVGYDPTLGGNAFAMRLVDHFAKAFLTKTKKDVFTNPKAIIKLHKEADRVKNVLSANADHTAQIEGLMDDVDFKLKVTRKEFEEMCADLFDRVKNPVDDAFKLAEMIQDEVGPVVLVGGSTRIPKVQEELMKATKKTELGKNLNTDEAPALGAVYQAAFASKGYKVLKFYIKDMNLFPIVVDFQRHSDSENPSAEKSYMRRTLFDKTNQFPQKKVMTFNKHTDDFDFNINYGDLSYLNGNALERIGSWNITEVNVTGVKEIFAKHEDEESRGIKVHFKIDDNGILNLEKIDIAFDKDGVQEDDEASTLSKLGSKISSFFGGSEDETQPKTEDEKSTSDDPVEDLKDQTKTPTEESATANTTMNNTTDPSQTNSTVAKNVTLTVREEISFTRLSLDFYEPTSDNVAESRRKLELIKQKEREIKKKAIAVNQLETFVFDTKDKLTQDEFISCSTETEREAIAEKLAQVTDWMDEADINVETKEYNEQYKLLKKTCKDVSFRMSEKKLRPKKLDELKEVMNKSMNFLETIKNLTGGEDQPLTQTQYDTFAKLIDSTRDWEVKMVEEQSKLADNEQPKLLSNDVHDKAEALKREIGYLLTKVKYFRPPVKKPVKTEKKSNETETEKKSSEKETDDKEASDEKADDAEESTSEKSKMDEETTSEQESTTEGTTENATDNPEL